MSVSHIEFLTQSYRRKVYRNIYFCPAQSILDDICDPEDTETIDSIIQLTSGVNHQSPQFLRSFQYATLEDPAIFSVFQQENWSLTRFNAGTDYGVWYAAEDETTSIFEAAWWAYLLGKDNVFSSGKQYITERAMYQATVDAKRAADLTLKKEWYEALTDSNDYTFCQKIGLKAFQENIEVLRTFSARHRLGVCVPVFSQEVIFKPSLIYYLTITVSPNGKIQIESGKKKMNFSFEISTWESDIPLSEYP